MRFYYTTTAGVAEQGYTRPQPERSLGGFRSATPVPNGAFNSLFGDISMYTVFQNQNECIGLILKNETGSNVENVFIWFNFPEDSYSKFQIAAVDLNTDSQDRKFMEDIPTINSIPYYSTFVDAEGEDNKADIGSLPVGGEVGIWFRRVLNKENIEADRDDLVYKVNPDDRTYVEKELGKEDEITVNLSWDVAPAE